MALQKGTFHPLTLTLAEIKNIFAAQGFSVALGPEMEDEWHNFDALNVPKDHPARDMQDTFWIKDKPGFVMRTHTSPVQIRYMETHQPPFAIIAPGKVFRNEATDATHEAQFHQVEGLVVGEGITVEHLKGTLLDFFKQLFGTETEIRLRPSFFPFVEPGFEVDVRVGEKWLEVCGAGMVHPNVLKNVGYDPEKVSGFAFGMGLDRLANVKLGFPDVRLLYQGDLRLNQW
jgi:phenylalanyl-tRNA synthetase alpha chain